MRRFLLLIAALLALSNANIYVRVTHGAVQAPPLDIKANDTTITTDVTFGTVTGYLKVSPGFYEVDFLAHGTNTSLFKLGITLQDGKTYTLVATGDPAHNASTFVVVPLDDDNSSPADRYSSRVRAFHGIADIPDAQFLLDDVVVAELTYKQVSTYSTVSAGDHVFTIKRKVGDVYSLVYTEQVTLLGGTVYSGFAVGLFNGSGIDLVPSNDAVYNYLTARFAHASENAPALDAYLKDGVDNVSTKLFTNLAFTQFSNYISVPFEPSKNYFVFVTATGQNTPLYSTDVTLTDGMVVTATALGILSNATTTPFFVQFYIDSNGAPTNPRTSGLKFVHTIPGALPATFVVGNQNVFSNIPYGIGSVPTTLVASLYTVHVVVNGSTIISQQVDFDAGAIYSFFLEGTLANPSLQMTKDAAYTYATVRASHAAPELGNVDVVLRDVHGAEVNRFPNVAFGTNTAYALVVLQTLTVNLEMGANKILSNPVAFTKDTLNTVAIFGTTNANFTSPLATAVIPDDNSSPTDSQTVRVRFVNALVGADPLTVNFGQTAMFTNVAFKSATAYNQAVMQGTYTVTVTSGTMTLLSFSQFFAGGSVYTIFAEGEVGAHSKVPAMQIVNMDASYQYTTLRVAHASSDAPNADVYLYNGIDFPLLVFQNVAYGSISAYKEVVLSNYTIKFAQTQTINFLASQTVNMMQNTVYTSSLIGQAKTNTTTPLSVSTFIDDQTDPSNSFTARGRFVHAVADGAPHVDVYFNDQLRFPNMAYGSVTDYANFDAKSYRVDIYVAGGETKLASLDINLVGGQVFTIFAEGTPAKIDSKIFPDFAVTFYRLRFAHASPNAGAVNVLVEGVAMWSDVTFNEITMFQEFTSDKMNVVINGTSFAIQHTTGFPMNQDSTLLLVGLHTPNSTTPLESIIVSNKVTAPASPTVANIRVTHASPNVPGLNIRFNETVLFTDVSYKMTTAYQPLAAGEYTVEANTTAGLLKGTVTLKGGLSYTLFLEGMFPTVTVIQETDYFPPSDARVRFLHASPDTGAVDFLINGSADIRNVEFMKASDYITTIDGETDFNVVPNGLLKPFLIDTSSMLAQGTDYSFFLVGLSDKNSTTHLSHVILADDNTLPPEGKVNVRFVHASPNGGSVDVKISGETVPIFMNVSYKEGTKYVTLDANFYDFDVLLSGKSDVATSVRFDLRVATGSAVYTLVAEGMADKMTVVSFLDNGSAPPGDNSSSKHKKGLSGLQIGLIIGGVAVGVIIIAALGFIVYKKRKERAGYSEIASKE